MGEGKVGNVITVGDNVGRKLACTTGGNDPSTTNVNILQDMLARVPPIQSPTQTPPTECWTPRSIRFPPSELEMIVDATQHAHSTIRTHWMPTPSYRTRNGGLKGVWCRPLLSRRGMTIHHAISVVLYRQICVPTWRTLTSRETFPPGHCLLAARKAIWEMLTGTPG